MRALKRRGHECIAVACQGPRPLPAEVRFDGIPVHRFRFHDALLRKDLAAIKRLTAEVAALKREFQPDVIHVNSSQPSVLFHEKSRLPSRRPSSSRYTSRRSPLPATRCSRVCCGGRIGSWAFRKPCSTTHAPSRPRSTGGAASSTTPSTTRPTPLAYPSIRKRGNSFLSGVSCERRAVIRPSVRCRRPRRVRRRRADDRR